jgi:hypothetical protein
LAACSQHRKRLQLNSSSSSTLCWLSAGTTVPVLQSIQTFWLAGALAASNTVAAASATAAAVLLLLLLLLLGIPCLMG